jgi:hypothetical protein
MVSHLLLAADIVMAASSVTTAVFLGAIVTRAEMKTALTMTSKATMNEMHHGALSTLLSDLQPREGKG